MDTVTYVRSCVGQPCGIFNTGNAEHKVDRQNKLFIQTFAQLAQNGLLTGKALSVFLSLLPQF